MPTTGVESYLLTCTQILAAKNVSHRHGRQVRARTDQILIRHALVLRYMIPDLSLMQPG
jgi:hypothetical protein